MLASFSEFKFFQSFRIPVEEADDIRFLVEAEDSTKSKWDYIEDAKLVDVSVNGLGFSTITRFSVGQILRISIYFKRIQLDISGRVVRAFTGNYTENTIVYGVEFEDEDNEDTKKFIEQYIYSFNPDRLRDCMVQMVLTDRYSSAAEGFEMFSLLLSLFKDMTNFGEKDDFIQVMLEEVVRVMSASRASIYLINSESNELETIVHVGEEKKKFDYREGVAGSVFTTGISLNLDTQNDSSRFLDLKDGEDNILSIICTPIYNREDKIIGAIEVINKRNDQRFSIDDEKSMKVIALVFSSIFHNFNPVSENTKIRRFSPAYDRKYVIIGKSKYSLDLRNTIVKIKDLDCPLFIEGEVGTGKSLFSKVLHYEGKRGVKKYREIFCGGKTEEDLEKEIFGSDGTTESSIFRECHRGTVFFNEISHMPIRIQNKVLQFIKTKCMPYANNGLDVRVTCSSSQKLKKLANSGRFNPELCELFYKAKVYLQPLHKRMEDLKDLITHFIKFECRKQGLLLKSFAPSVMEQFVNYDWPGNIGELRDCIEKAILYNPKTHVINNISNLARPLLESGHTAQKMFDDIPHASDSEVLLKDRLALIERQMILAEIKRNGGNKSKAAREMGISREALRKKLMISHEILEQLEKKTSASASSGLSSSEEPGGEEMQARSEKSNSERAA